MDMYWGWGCDVNIVCMYLFCVMKFNWLRVLFLKFMDCDFDL